MKWEKRLAVLLVIVIFIFVARNLLYRVDEQNFTATTSQTSPQVIGTGDRIYFTYFPTEDGQYLQPEFRLGEARIAQILSDLETGPQSSFLSPVLPRETKVLSYSLQGPLLLVNFSEHLVTNQPGGSRAEILTVYGIVNSLVGVESVEKVQILVNNERVLSLAGHVLIDEPLSKDYSIIGAWGN